MSFYEINNKPEIETNWDWGEIETNQQSQSQAFDCIYVPWRNHRQLQHIFIYNNQPNTSTILNKNNWQFLFIFLFIKRELIKKFFVHRNIQSIFNNASKLKENSYSKIPSLHLQEMPKFQSLCRWYTEALNKKMSKLGILYGV